MRATFKWKMPEIEADEFIVEKVLVLPAKDYMHFTRHLVDEYDFIKENKKFMYERDGVWHCVLVTGEGVGEGVLVESEGYSYAKYSAFLPSITGIIQQLEPTCKVEKTELNTKEIELIMGI